MYPAARPHSLLTRVAGGAVGRARARLLLPCYPLTRNLNPAPSGDLPAAPHAEPGEQQLRGGTGLPAQPADPGALRNQGQALCRCSQMHMNGRRAWVCTCPLGCHLHPRCHTCLQLTGVVPCFLLLARCPRPPALLCSGQAAGSQPRPVRSGRGAHHPARPLIQPPRAAGWDRQMVRHLAVPSGEPSGGGQFVFLLFLLAVLRLPLIVPLPTPLVCRLHSASLPHSCCVHSTIMYQLARRQHFPADCCRRCLGAAALARPSPWPACIIWPACAPPVAA